MFFFIKLSKNRMHVKWLYKNHLYIWKKKFNLSHKYKIISIFLVDVYPFHISYPFPVGPCQPAILHIAKICINVLLLLVVDRDVTQPNNKQFRGNSWWEKCGNVFAFNTFKFEAVIFSVYLYGFILNERLK